MRKTTFCDVDVIKGIGLGVRDGDFTVLAGSRPGRMLEIGRGQARKEDRAQASGGPEQARHSPP